ncbi:hypothetical protein AMTRI_Chr09g32230 [Amborella trichopoda]
MQLFSQSYSSALFFFLFFWQNIYQQITISSVILPNVASYVTSPLPISSIIKKTNSQNLNSLHDGSHPSSKIIALCSERKLNEALQMLRSLDSKVMILHPNVYSMILQLCIELKSTKQGTLVHDHLLRSGVQSNVHLNTKFIVFYAKSGDLEMAKQVFDGMPERTVVSWTALISGYSQHGFSSDALDLFNLMRIAGVKANQFTYASVVRACTCFTCIKHGYQVQACIMKTRFYNDIFVRCALVDMHAKCGCIDDARCLFDGMERRDLVSWNAIIGGYIAHGLIESALGLFRSMLDEGMTPDQFTLASILASCGIIEDLIGAQQLHGLIIQLGLESDKMISGALVHAYAKCKSLESAKRLYNSIADKEKDLITTTALMTGYAQNHGRAHYASAMELFHEIHGQDMKMDDVILSSILSICGSVASLSLGKQVHAHVVKYRPRPDVALGNALVDMYAKSGELRDARRAFDEMPETNVISWSSMIAAYGCHGFGEEAIQLFEQMESIGPGPNDVTLLTVLSACSHSGMVERGWARFKAMVNGCHIKLRDEHYSCIVDLLGRAGLLDEAYRFICDMPKKPSPSLWLALLGACRTHGNVEMGEIAAKHLFEIEPQNSGGYVVLANIYAAAGLWEDAVRVRELMRDKGVRKEAGCSYI